MEMYEIQLPAYVTENELFDLISTLGQGNQHPEIIVNFSDVCFYTPAAIVALITKFRAWVHDEKKVSITGYDTCSSFKYLQRIDFFTCCGIVTEESFERFSSRGRFVELSEITHDTTTLATRIAECIAPDQKDLYEPSETAFFDCIEYAVSELGNNVRQHSGGNGYCCAQYFEDEDYTRVAIADCGMGIEKSLKGSPHWHDNMNDLDAIKEALKSGVSCKTHLTAWGESPNAGVGLSLLTSVASKLKGSFHIVSGAGSHTLRSSDELAPDHYFKGTLCSFTFKRNEIKNFANLLYSAKKDLGLITNMSQFKDMFS